METWADHVPDEKVRGKRRAEKHFDKDQVEPTVSWKLVT